jgi:hypothetical protein
MNRIKKNNNTALSEQFQNPIEKAQKEAKSISTTKSMYGNNGTK